MLKRLSRRGCTLLASTVLVLGLAACGSETLDTTEPAASGGASTDASVSVPTPQVDEALAAKVPEKYRGATLVDGSDASYAPNEFIAEDGTTIQGMDIDLLNAVATTLGLKVEYNNAGFDTILLGVTSGKYDIAISSFTINPDRKKQVHMVQYFSAGTLWVAPKGNPKNVDPDNACGLSIGVQKGTVQVDDLEKKSKACTDAGEEPIKQVIEAEQSKVTADVVSGKADAMLADSPISIYSITQTNDQLELVGEMYDAAPYGIVVAKENTELANVISEALAKLKADGTYDAILKKWGSESGSVDEFPVNP